MTSYKLPNLPNEHYTVGWICALSTEYVAAQVFLDEKHGRPDSVATHDNNDYALGRIGRHNVAIAVLPGGEYGTVSAAGVARDMLHTFPNIRIGLMVGIGGGAPSAKHDIRLGDVVVSEPHNGLGGVFQYDFGKNIQDQEFQATRFLAPPPTVLLTAINGLKAEYTIDGHTIREDIRACLANNSRLRKGFSAPSVKEDRLYFSEVIYRPGETATDGVSVKTRPARDKDDDDPAIHYGLIASANQLMEDARLRDRYADEKNVLCFETEAGGLMNHFPCLVIRGICDYSDTHKNEEWQGYAAMTAAAYARDLLKRVSPKKLESEKTIREFLENAGTVLGEVAAVSVEIRDKVDNMKALKQMEKIAEWLSPPDPSTNLNHARELHQSGTGQWLLDSDKYKLWKATPGSFLWLYGIPGCGKTIISSTVVADLQDRKATAQSLLYFYFNFTDASKRLTENAVRSLADQLYHTSACTRGVLNTLFEACKEQQPSPRRLQVAFQDMLNECKEVWIVLDGLDECDTRSQYDANGIMPWLTNMKKSSKNIHLLVTSRPEQDIKFVIEEWAAPTQIISLQSDLVADDIGAYIKTKVDQMNRWRSRPDIQDLVKNTLKAKADGMFRWVACQFDTLEQCLSPHSLREALATLPRTLDETYARILDRIPPEYKVNAFRLLQLLTYSGRPLSVQEAVDAMAIEPATCPPFHPVNRMPIPEEITRYCSGLVSITNRCDYSDIDEFDDSDYSDYSGYSDLSDSDECLDDDDDEDDDDSEDDSDKTPIPENEDDEDGEDDSLDAGDEGGEVAEDDDDYIGEADTAGSDLFELSSCSSEVNGAERSQIQLAHFSVQEYLRSNRLEPAIADHLNQKAAAASIVELCISYLSSLEIPPPLEEMATEHPFNNSLLSCWPGRDLLLSVKNGKASLWFDKLAEEYPFARFSAKYWPEFAAIFESSDDGVIQAVKQYYATQSVFVMGYLTYPPDKFKAYQSTLNATSPLYYASFAGLPNSVQMLLGMGADVHTECGYFGSSLLAASVGGHRDIAEMLIQNGAHVNGQAGQNKTYLFPLLAAALHGNAAVAQLLIEHGADVNAVLREPDDEGDDESGRHFGSEIGGDGGTLTYTTALQTASGEGHQDIVEILLRNGADVNVEGGQHGSALQAACYGGHWSIAEVLLQNGADVDANCGSYGSSLQVATYGEHGEVVQILLQHGAGGYINALQAASFAGYHGTVEALLRKGVDINAPGDDYSNSLQAASMGGRQNIVQLLLKNGAAIDASGGHGTALCIASRKGYLPIVEILLQSNANVNAASEYHGTALQAAAYAGHPRVVELLLRSGADIDACGAEHGRALQAAACGGYKVEVQAEYPVSYTEHEETVRLLIRHGADVNARGGRYGSALKAALANKLDPIVRILISSGATAGADDKIPDMQVTMRDTKKSMALTPEAVLFLDTATF